MKGAAIQFHVETQPLCAEDVQAESCRLQFGRIAEPFLSRVFQQGLPYLFPVVMNELEHTLLVASLGKEGKNLPVGYFQGVMGGSPAAPKRDTSQFIVLNLLFHSFTKVIHCGK